MIRVQTNEGFAIEFPRLKELEHFINGCFDFVDYLKISDDPDYEKEKAYLDCFLKAYEENK